MAISDSNTRLTIIISKENKSFLEELAKKQGRSLSNLVGHTLEDLITSEKTKQEA